MDIKKQLDNLTKQVSPNVESIKQLTEITEKINANPEGYYNEEHFAEFFEKLVKQLDNLFHDFQPASVDEQDFNKPSDFNKV